jgi:hypothetical protein
MGEFEGLMEQERTETTEELAIVLALFPSSTLFPLIAKEQPCILCLPRHPD